MPSRRILSNSKLVPIQKAAVNPFASFNSDSVNRLTKIVSGGKDVVVSGLDVLSGDDNSFSTNIELVKPYDNETQFIENWEGRNFYYHGGDVDPRIDLYLPSGRTCDFSYIQCNLDTSKISYLIGTPDPINREFEIKFQLIKGTPKSLTVYINDSSYTLDHPTGGYNNFYSVKVTRDLIHDNLTNGLKFKIGVVLDSADPDSIQNKENANFKTSVSIGSISCKLLQNCETNVTKIATNYSGIYNSSAIHNVHSLKITPGIAIKDDVMIQIMGNTHKDSNTAIYLDLNDNNSWIKGKGFSGLEFPQINPAQWLYQYNGRFSEETDDGKLTATFDDYGNIKVDLGNGKTCKALGDFDLNQETDVNLKYIFTDDTEHKKYIFEWKEIQSKGICGDSALLIFKDDTVNTDVVITRTTVTTNNTSVISFKLELDYNQIPLRLKQLIDTSSDKQATAIQYVKFILTTGPIKVSGNQLRYIKENVKWAYVVLYYSYFRNPKPNIAYIGLAREEDVKDVKFGEDYLILAKVRFIDKNTIDIISYEDRQIHKIPDSDQVAYGPVCGDPEVWEGSLPMSVSEALNILRKIVRYSVTSKDTPLPKANLPEMFRD